MPSMVQFPHLLLCLFYGFTFLFAGVGARVAALEPFAEPPPVTEAPQAALGRLQKRDSPICGYFNGVAQSSLTCNAPNDCYIFTAGSGFYSAKAACGQKAAASYDGPWGLCVNYNGGLCPNVASCSSVYTSVLFCPAQYPYCVRYEMRDVPTDPFYYVLLDCTTVSHQLPIQILFKPTTTEATLHLGPTTPTPPAPTTVNPTPSPSPTSAAPTSTTAPSSSPTTATTQSSSPTPTPTSPTTSQNTASPTSDPTSSPDTSSGSTGLTVGDKAGIAGAIVGAVAIFTGIVSVAFPHETRVFLSYIFCCCCARQSMPAYSPAPVHMNYVN